MTQPAFGLAILFLLSATAYAFAGTLSAGGPASSTQTTQSSQDQSTPTPSEAPKLNQPSAAQGAGQPVTSLSKPEQKLASAPVQDMLGRPIGTVERVQTDTRGAPTSLRVLLNTQNEAGKSVTIPATQMTYNAKSHVVVAELTQTEIDAMPGMAAPSNSNPASQSPSTTQGPSGATPPGN